MVRLHELFNNYYCICFLSITALESTPTDDVDAIEDTELPTQPASNEEDDTDISPIYQPEVFLAAKTVHRRFLNLVIQLKQKLKDYDPQMLLMAFNKLSASSSTAIHHKIIPLLPSDYLESLHNVSSEEILSRSAFLSTWNNHSILRALLEACNCQDGIKMLDDFESQIDTKQPMELFPIPPPSMKMAPSLSSAYTVLSIRGKPYQDKLVPLQYVSDVAKIIMEKFNISQHALQLLATRASPLMLYWTISKNIVPLISKGVNDHLDFLKENGFSEIAIYPNTILFATDTLSHGSYALLSSQPQVSILCICDFVMMKLYLNLRHTYTTHTSFAHTYTQHTRTHAHTHNTHTHTHTHTQTRTQTHAYTRTHARIHTHGDTHTHTRGHTHTHKHTHTQTHTQIHKHTHTNTYTHIHTNKHTHAHIHTHTSTLVYT